jgi:signal transduction histidine kinase
MASHSLIVRSLAEVRLTQGIQNREQFSVAAFIEEIASASTLDANARGVTLIVTPVDVALVIAADRQVLAAVVANLLQNAFKFTRPRTRITLTVGASAERVIIEVQDECGGLPSGDVNELFRPFEQRSANRTGVGLGLAFSRWGAEANDGRLYARNLPGRGCVFTVDLPRVPVPAATVVQS